MEGRGRRWRRGRGLIYRRGLSRGAANVQCSPGHGVGVTAGTWKLGWCLPDGGRGGVFGVVSRFRPMVWSVTTIGNGRGDHSGYGWETRGLLLLLVLMLLWRRRLYVILLVGIVCVPRDVHFAVRVVRLSHTVEYNGRDVADRPSRLNQVLSLKRSPARHGNLHETGDDQLLLLALLLLLLLLLVQGEPGGRRAGGGLLHACEGQLLLLLVRRASPRPRHRRGRPRRRCRRRREGRRHLVEVVGEGEDQVGVGDGGGGERIVVVVVLGGGGLPDRRRRGYLVEVVGEGQD